MDKIPAVEEFNLIHLNEWIIVIEKYSWDKLINQFSTVKKVAYEERSSLNALLKNIEIFWQNLKNFNKFSS